MNSSSTSRYSSSDEDRRRMSRSSSSSSSSFDETKRSTLISMIYTGDEQNEILVFERKRIVFKGCLQSQDRFRFKISREMIDNDELELKFYVNDRFRCRWKICCEFRLIDEQNQRKDIFQIENLFGAKLCRKCEKLARRSKSKTKNVEKTKKDQREKAPSEGFRADLTEVDETHLNNENDDDNSLKFEPIPCSSTFNEENPPVEAKKRIYGPPQLSTMLSINDPVDSTYLRSTNGNDFSSIRIEEKKEETRTSSDENEENSTNQSTRFLRSLSSHISTNNDETPQRIFHRTTTTTTTIDRSSTADATATILSRLGITRHEENDRSESSSISGPREKGNCEHFVLFYLNEKKIDRNDLIRLRSIVNFVKIFDDFDECVASINSFINEKLILVGSKDFIQRILPRVEDLQQLFNIYIQKSSDDCLSTIDWNSKRIRGVFSTIDDLCQVLSSDIQLVLRDLVSYVQFNLDSSNSSTATFVYSSLINEILLNSSECQSAMNELIHFSRDEYEGNEHELTIIDEFQTDYQSDRSIWWFTRPCFISKMLNRAFQTPDLDILYRFRLFIQHLRQQIENESSIDSDEQLTTVYLGQTIHQNDFDELNRLKTTSNYLYFNQFLSGTSSLSSAIEIAENLPRTSDDFISLIIQLDLSNHLNFANRSSLRYLDNDGNDVLLNIGIIGKIVRIEHMDSDEETGKGYGCLHLELVRLENERELKTLLEVKREEILVPSPLISFVKLMLTTNQNQRAGHFIESIHHDTTISSDPNIQGSVAASCHLIGSAAHQQGDFQQAVHLFQLSLKTFLRFVEEDSVQLSPTYNNIGSMFFRQEQYDKSLFYHNKALEVQLNSSNPNLNSIASYSNNIGVVYLKQGQYQNALKAFHRALKVLKQMKTDENASDLASTHDNLGDAYLLIENYEQALTHYRQALEIQQKIDPINPQSLASFNNSLGNVYNKLQRYSDALSHFQEAVKYQKEYLPETHPSFASLFNNIGSMFYRQELYAEALPFYLKSLEIEMMVLQQNNPTIAVTHFNIATTYTGLGRFDDAIRSTERSIEQLLKTLPENHPEVIENRAYLDMIRKKQMLKGLFQENQNGA